MVMPVYNEQASVARVIRDWFPILENIVDDFTLLAIDDGATDETATIPRGISEDLGPRLEILSRPNHGHGQTCLQGYRIALERKIPFILQIDSDGQSDPKYFPDFWEQRERFDVIYGKRNRMDGFRRIVASSILRKLLRIFANVDCEDANVPHPLMKSANCASAIQSVTSDLYLANIALAVILRKDPSIHHGLIPIGFPPRHGGEPSVPFMNFASKGIELFAQLKQAGIR
jgi:glycosyltransferase involved in cell wall biosynthesis